MSMLVNKRGAVRAIWTIWIMTVQLSASPKQSDPIHTADCKLSLAHGVLLITAGGLSGRVPAGMGQNHANEVLSIEGCG